MGAAAQTREGSSACREAAEHLVPAAVLAVVRIDPFEPRLAVSPELVLDDHAPRLGDAARKSRVLRTNGMVAGRIDA